MTPSCPPLTIRLPVDPRSIISNPGRYAHMPEPLRTRFFRNAWLAAKSQSGHPARQSRLNAMTARPFGGDAA